jgi:hypothetical protein
MSPKLVFKRIMEFPSYIVTYIESTYGSRPYDAYNSRFFHDYQLKLALSNRIVVI